MLRTHIFKWSANQLVNLPGIPFIYQDTSKMLTSFDLAGQNTTSKNGTQLEHPALSLTEETKPY